MIRVLVTGDRNYTDRQAVYEELSRLQNETLAPDKANPGKNLGDFILIHGSARGADTLAADVAQELGWTIEGYPADWKQYGRAAGPIRNTQMLESGHPDIVVAFHQHLSESKGTKHMVIIAKKAGIPVWHHEAGRYI